MSAYRALAALPDLASIHGHAPDRWPFLLDSASRGGGLGRFSLLLYADPDMPPLLAGAHGGRFLERLDAAFDRDRAVQPGRLPFEGGWFVYLGYELAGAIEPKLNLAPPGSGEAVALARRCPGALVVDHTQARAWAVAENDALAESLVADAAAVPGGAGIPPALALPEMHAESGERFIAGVERIREYIRSGDVFQVNLSRAWRGRSESPLDPVQVYRQLAASNPAPFAGLARLPGGTLLSSSPERLVVVRGATVEARPIAGTRPRGQSVEHDRALSAELLAHPKERAEHIMLIDLVRNDLGRISVPGSMTVDELMVLESYTHVHHIVSNIRGRLHRDTTPGQIIGAVFPGGTITGCPKVRCMEIIAELESGARGFYTGSMGYLNRDGRMDLNILIRSMFVADHEIRFRTGAGIVADSEPGAELAETEAKARGLIRALSPEAVA